MKVSTFFSWVWRLASIIGFAAALLYTYTAFEPTVVVGFAPDRRPDTFISREVLFYSCVAIFLINNTLVNLVAKLFPRVSGVSLPIPNAGAWQEHRDQLNEVVRNWLYCIMAAVNTVMGISLVVLMKLNKQVGVSRVGSYEWLLPICLGIIAIVVVALPIRLLMKPDSED